MTKALHFGDRSIYDEDHEAFRGVVRDFIKKEVVPNDEKWELAGAPDHDYFRRAGERGLLMFGVGEEFDGPGIDDFRYNAVLNEEFWRANFGAAGLSLTLHNDVVAPYFTDLNRPGFSGGRVVPAAAAARGC